MQEDPHESAVMLSRPRWTNATPHLHECQDSWNHQTDRRAIIMSKSTSITSEQLCAISSICHPEVEEVDIVRVGNSSQYRPSSTISTRKQKIDVSTIPVALCVIEDKGLESNFTLYFSLFHFV